MSTEENKQNISLSVNDLSNNSLPIDDNSVESHQDEIPNKAEAAAPKTSLMSELLNRGYAVSDISGNKNWFTQTEYIIFKSELKFSKKNPPPMKTFAKNIIHSKLFLIAFGFAAVQA